MISVTEKDRSIVAISSGREFKALSSMISEMKAGFSLSGFENSVFTGF